MPVVPLSCDGLVRLRLDEAYFCCLCEPQAEGLLKPLREVEMPLVPVLAQMEAVGVAVDPTIFAKHKVTDSHAAPTLFLCFISMSFWSVYCTILCEIRVSTSG